MATYSLDIGFNLSLRPSPANEEEALLTQGFTEIGIIGNPVFNSRSFKREDVLRVTLYDLTAPLLSLAPIEKMSFKLTFSAAQEGQASMTPVNGPQVFENFMIFPGPNPQKSTVFEGDRVPLYFLFLGGPRFPENQLQPVDPNVVVSEAIFTLVNGGHYYFTLELWVWLEGNSDPRKFRVDPEMIVDPTGPGGGPGS